MYRSLNAELIVQTCRATRERIAAQFPNSGLSQIAGEISAVSEQAAGKAAWLAKPHLPLRTLASLGIVSIVAIVVGVGLHVQVQMNVGSIAEFLQGLDAAINAVIFFVIAVFFFITLETRLKRRRALRAINELRSLAHVIDMHQLTKDPERIVLPAMEPAGSAKRPRNPAELIRYLDHCSDLLALISKIAVLYVQDFDDAITRAAVNEIENLTNGLARKIWQKIVIFDRILAPANGTAPPRVARNA